MTADNQEGQTLLAFALTTGLLMVGLLALVGDNAVLQVRYNQVDEAAVLAVQAASSDIDITAFVATHRAQLADDAERVCKEVAMENAPPGSSVTCSVPADRSSVRADVVDAGPLPTRLLGEVFTIRATHVGRPAYGVARPCAVPTDPSTCS